MRTHQARGSKEPSGRQPDILGRAGRRFRHYRDLDADEQATARERFEQGESITAIAASLAVYGGSLVDARDSERWDQTGRKPTAAAFVRELLKANPRMTNGEIAAEVGCSPAYVSNLRQVGMPARRKPRQRKPVTWGPNVRVEPVRYEPIPSPVFQFVGEHVEGCE